MAATNAQISAPATGRDAYINAASAAAGTARTRGSSPATSVESTRYVDAKSDSTQASARTDRRWLDSETATPNQTDISSGPSRTIPFLAQLLAQENPPGSDEPASDEESVLPSVRSAAQQAYLAARDSTVDYLSPTPLYDLFA